MSETKTVNYSKLVGVIVVLFLVGLALTLYAQTSGPLGTADKSCDKAVIATCPKAAAKTCDMAGTGACPKAAQMSCDKAGTAACPKAAAKTCDKAGTAACPKAASTTCGKAEAKVGCGITAAQAYPMATEQASGETQVKSCCPKAAAKQ